jgi:hypothetical protein
VLEQHFNGTLLFSKRNSFASDAILTRVNVVLMVERFRNSSGVNYELEQIKYSNALIFLYLSLFSNVTVK